MTHSEALQDTNVAWIKAYENLLQAIRDKWNEIKEFFKDIEFKAVPKVKWFYPSVIPFMSQFINRKPRMIRARCNC